MVEPCLRSGTVAYYRTPRAKDLKAGVMIDDEALGADYAATIARAEALSGHLDARRKGQGTSKESAALTRGERADAPGSLARRGSRKNCRPKTAGASAILPCTRFQWLQRHQPLRLLSLTVQPRCARQGAKH